EFRSEDGLPAALDVHPQTIRRAIRELEEGGSLKRHRGGASSGGNLPEGLPASRQTRCQNEKNAIARLIADHIPDSSSLFVSIG
ncbi:DeoR family transcriptional regulator, partial [Neisseria meningitidis]|uniref:DeoR family transcriptional regulator n=1 Tax=Neisseria meningitidis TaxID=487 RepID=UPI000CC0CB44